MNIIYTAIGVITVGRQVFGSHGPAFQTNGRGMERYEIFKISIQLKI